MGIGEPQNFIDITKSEENLKHSFKENLKHIEQERTVLGRSFPSILLTGGKTSTLSSPSSFTKLLIILVSPRSLGKKNSPWRTKRVKSQYSGLFTTYG